ncbi:hypothetical protein ONZ45_g17753 [Pleurotus djamor]|nr:hypothetical protein ONZ45_g17753 [Pleurotus djamor]
MDWDSINFYLTLQDVTTRKAYSTLALSSVLPSTVHALDSGARASSTASMTASSMLYSTESYPLLSVPNTTASSTYASRTMTSYNLHQQISIIYSASNIATNSSGTLADLQKLMSQNLQPTLDKLRIGDWKVIWLNVWKAIPGDASSPADHVWFVTRNPAVVFEDGKPCDTYVISIAGLSSGSFVNHLEATSVGLVVDFEQWDPATSPIVAFSIDEKKPYISLGCALGAYCLLTVPNSDGITLLQFLQSVPASARIVFTGASLGGMLSPTVAMAVVKAKGIMVPISQIFTYPVSGPTPGNRAFAQLYASTFPRIETGSAIYQVWNSVIWNTFDIVPHLWNIDSDPGRNLSKIPTLYGPLSGKLKVIVDFGVGLAEVLPRTAPVIYTPLQGTEITPVQPTTPEDFKEWASIVGTQHVQSYADVIGIPVLPPLSGSPDSYERLKQVPLFSIFEEARKEKEREPEVA